jgi:hypothetical protein
VLQIACGHKDFGRTPLQKRIGKATHSSTSRGAQAIEQSWGLKSEEVNSSPPERPRRGERPTKQWERVWRFVSSLFVEDKGKRTYVRHAFNEVPVCARQLLFSCCSPVFGGHMQTSCAFPFSFFLGIHKKKGVDGECR